MTGCFCLPSPCPPSAVHHSHPGPVCQQFTCFVYSIPVDRVFVPWIGQAAANEHAGPFVPSNSVCYSPRECGETGACSPGS
ncbi:hypothetical protein DM02DRAFT_220321 [Periconia macrospinosa]|uniref:Uncharacterized protein n=1 Tax=Periconia macrospinosa TaxID=97972 RepID=A0A2V1E3S1_9PLEO|nr:hypothetical protein DM02DRAFT_220321 [Periconia macrospinosa]